MIYNNFSNGEYTFPQGKNKNNIYKKNRLTQSKVPFSLSLWKSNAVSMMANTN